MKIETTTGHYGITVTGNVDAAKLEELATLGLAQGVLYRGVFAELRETTGAKRKLEDCAQFNEDVALTVMEAVEKAVKTYMPDAKVDVVNYEGGEGATSSRKMATEMVEKVRENDAMRLVLGIAPGATEAEMVEKCHVFLAGLRKKK